MGRLCRRRRAGRQFENCYWCQDKEIAGICSDTWGVEVRPNETKEANQPWHWVVIPAMGLTMGEIFYLKDLAEDCAEDKAYEFFFCAPPLVITGGTGSPINPHGDQMNRLSPLCGERPSRAVRRDRVRGVSGEFMLKRPLTRRLLCALGAKPLPASGARRMTALFTGRYTMKDESYGVKLIGHDLLARAGRRRRGHVAAEGEGRAPHPMAGA